MSRYPCAYKCSFYRVISSDLRSSHESTCPNMFGLSLSPLHVHMSSDLIYDRTSDTHPLRPYTLQSLHRGKKIEKVHRVVLQVLQLLFCARSGHLEAGAGR
jgi:hypothetical protein